MLRGGLILFWNTHFRVLNCSSSSVVLGDDFLAWDLKIHVKQKSNDDDEKDGIFFTFLRLHVVTIVAVPSVRTLVINHNSP